MCPLQYRCVSEEKIDWWQMDHALRTRLHVCVVTEFYVCADMHNRYVYVQLERIELLA